MEIFKDVGSMSNYYGGLAIKKDGELYYWAIESHDGFRWDPIPETLYNELKKFALENME